MKEKRKGSENADVLCMSEDEASLFRVSPLSAMVGGGLPSSSNSHTLVLPCLGPKFKGREKFLNDVIASLDDLQEVSRVLASASISLLEHSSCNFLL